MTIQKLKDLPQIFKIWVKDRSGYLKEELQVKQDIQDINLGYQNKELVNVHNPALKDNDRDEK